MTTDQTAPETPIEELDAVVIRFAGDSGDGMQLTGDQFAMAAARFGNDLATLPDYPAEIRAPAGSLRGVSSFQLHFAAHDVLTSGDRVDVLVAMNPSALKMNVGDLRPGGVLICDTHTFSETALMKAGYEESPLDDGSLDEYTVHAIDLTELTADAVAESGMTRKEAVRAKNMFALGLISWMFTRPIERTQEFLHKKFSSKPTILAGNLAALNAGWYYGETTETFAVKYQVPAGNNEAGSYRNITGNTAAAYGLVAAAAKAGIPLFLGAYPITPATDILHELSKLAKLGVRTFQAEDEIAAVGSAIGASYAGMLGATSTSGPGMSLKAEMLGLAVMLEIPLVIINVQRGGPSTGLPTKTEQSDLLQAMYGRHGESPMPILAAKSPADAFDTVVEATRVAIKHRTPVIVLSDANIANGSEPWRVPPLSELPDIDPDFALVPNAVDTKGEPVFEPYQRDELLSRPWAIPGTPELMHRVGGLEKADITGEISYDPANHFHMVNLRQEKVRAIEIPPLQIDDPGRAVGDPASVIVVGWGSTHGPISEACRELRRRGIPIAQAHLRYLNPLPRNLRELNGYAKVVVPEMNLGQLSMLLRAEGLIDTVSLAQVNGLPFSAVALAETLEAFVTDQEQS